MLTLGLARGFGVALVAELAVLLGIGGLVALHVRRGRAEIRPPAWITHLTLAAGALLCGLAVVASA